MEHRMKDRLKYQLWGIWQYFLNCIQNEDFSTCLCCCLHVVALLVFKNILFMKKRPILQPLHLWLLDLWWHCKADHIRMDYLCRVTRHPAELETRCTVSNTSGCVAVYERSHKSRAGASGQTRDDLKKSVSHCYVATIDQMFCNFWVKIQGVRHWHLAAQC